MTVKEILNNKYLEDLKHINSTRWNYIKSLPDHPAKTMYMGLEITVDDIKANGGYNGELWQEIVAMRKDKMIASNDRRQYSGHVTKYWLTEKGWRALNKDHAIC